MSFFVGTFERNQANTPFLHVSESELNEYDVGTCHVALTYLWLDII